MDISIITSIYKSESFLAKYLRRVESLQKNVQRFNMDSEVILVANDITHEEEELLIKNKITNLKIIRVPRETLYSSWNRGIREAKSEIIAFWNVDDIRFVKALVNGIRLIKNGRQLVYFSFISIGIMKYTLFNKKMTIQFPIFRKTKMVPYNRELFMKGCMCGPFFIFQRSLIDIIGSFDETFTIAGDFEWFARASYHNINFEGINNIGGIFYIHSANISGSNTNVHIKENSEVMDRYYAKREII
jgi:hypothetical protein